MEIRETVITTTDGYAAAPWPVSWSAAFTGALSTLAAVTVFGLFGTAIGMSSLNELKDFENWHQVTISALSAVVFGAFFANVIGGWIAGKITGSRYSETTSLHGAISWLITVPTLLVLLAVGAGKSFGGWYGGVLGAVHSATGVPGAADPAMVRNTAIAAATSLLVGLIGSVIGGWMSSGEPMTLTHHKTRPYSHH